MYYFKQDEEKMEKYEVRIEVKELEKIRVLIIDDCSEIVHEDYESTYEPNYFDYLQYRNYSSRKIGMKDGRDGPDEPIYHFIYDKYNFPELVDVIDGLLKGNVKVLDKLFNPTPRLSIEERIDAKSKEIDGIPNTSVYQKQKKLEELKKLLDIAKLNEHQKPVEPYYPLVKGLINMELVDSITFEEINRVRGFFGNDKAIFEDKLSR